MKKLWNLKLYFMKIWLVTKTFRSQTSSKPKNLKQKVKEQFKVSMKCRCKFYFWSTNFRFLIKATKWISRKVFLLTNKSLHHFHPLGASDRLNISKSREKDQTRMISSNKQKKGSTARGNKIFPFNIKQG